ncbi:hypothetical protein RclHR1_21150005 [Rhizophagus clarus]|uniref:Uncharacterized protein n=1 Tax=Rhizophagus clarus TaxID=94130 RepID=A0A2Z6RLK3_9GLOM|nr:hypothetical protein RclHR1_21150005 [Rhizophagus clarus]
MSCWTPGLGMLPAFLDEPDLGNVAGLLGRTRLGNVSCQPSWTNRTWEYCWTPDLKCCRPSWTNRTWEYCWTPDLKCCSFPYSS